MIFQVDPKGIQMNALLAMMHSMAFFAMTTRGKSTYIQLWCIVYTIYRNCIAYSLRWGTKTDAWTIVHALSDLCSYIDLIMEHHICCTEQTHLRFAKLSLDLFPSVQDMHLSYMHVSGTLCSGSLWLQLSDEHDLGQATRPQSFTLIVSKRP